MTVTLIRFRNETGVKVFPGEVLRHTGIEIHHGEVLYRCDNPDPDVVYSAAGVEIVGNAGKWNNVFVVHGAVENGAIGLCTQQLAVWALCEPVAPGQLVTPRSNRRLQNASWTINSGSPDEQTIKSLIEGWTVYDYDSDSGLALIGANVRDQPPL